LRSSILTAATRFLLPLLLLFSLFLLLRGHNMPGGGFVGGLVAAAAYALYTIACSVHEARRALRIPPLTLFPLGLMLAGGSGLLGLISGESYLSSFWLHGEVPILGKLGTPLMFDAGVYLLVIGIVLTIIFSLAED
jgi:multicomponent Na+:H+ antiporter subunit B